jgi:hypothetical protein
MIKVGADPEGTREWGLVGLGAWPCEFRRRVCWREIPLKVCHEVNEEGPTADSGDVAVFWGVHFQADRLILCRHHRDTCMEQECDDTETDDMEEHGATSYVCVVGSKNCLASP